MLFSGDTLSLKKNLKIRLVKYMHSLLRPLSNVYIYSTSLIVSWWQKKTLHSNMFHNFTISNQWLFNTEMQRHREKHDQSFVLSDSAFLCPLEKYEVGCRSLEVSFQTWGHEEELSVFCRSSAGSVELAKPRQRLTVVNNTNHLSPTVQNNNVI